jgi:two-component system nitrate/nitrite response regulator NarL
MLFVEFRNLRRELMSAPSTAHLEQNPTLKIEQKEYEKIDASLCRLVDLVDDMSSKLRLPDEAPTEEILLDRDIGNFRYILMRMPIAVSTRISLSPREKEIVEMVARGHPTKVIADILSISCWTVSAHLRRVFTKLGVTSRPAMIARFAEESFGREKVAAKRDPHADYRAPSKKDSGSRVYRTSAANLRSHEKVSS